MRTHLNISGYPLVENRSSAEHPLEIRLEKSWFTARHVVLLIFSLVWSGIWLHFYTNLSLKSAPLPLYVLLTLHAVAGIGMLYAALCGLVNKTIVQANKQQIKVWHSPFPWTGQYTIHTPDISQIYVAQQIHSQKGLTYITYDVELITKTDKVLPLFKDLDALAEARAIEKKLDVLRS